MFGVIYVLQISVRQTFFISLASRFVKQLKSEDKLNQLLQMLSSEVDLLALGDTSDIK